MNPMVKLTPFQRSCRKVLAEPYHGTDPALHRLQQESAALLDRLRDQNCDREPFTPDHAHCICRRTNRAADQIDRLEAALREIAFGNWAAPTVDSEAANIYAQIVAEMQERARNALSR